MASYKAIRLFFILIHANNGMLQVKRIKIGEECSTWKYSAWHGLINIMSSKTYHLLKSAVFQFCRFSSFLLIFKFLDCCDVDSVDIYILIHCLSLRLSTHHLKKKKTFSMLGNFSCLKFLLCCLLTFSKINFQEQFQGVRRFWSR